MISFAYVIIIELQKIGNATPDDDEKKGTGTPIMRCLRSYYPLVFILSMLVAYTLHGQVAADESITLDDVRGKSIDASVKIVEKMQKLNRDHILYLEILNRRLQIYVSSSGHIFDRESWDSNNGHQGHWDQVSLLGDANLKFESGFGFRRINYDAPKDKISTFAVVSDIPLSFGPAGLTCNVSIIYALKSGSHTYIKPVWTGDIWKVLWYRVSSNSCKIYDGNVFSSQN